MDHALPYMKQQYLLASIVRLLSSNCIAQNVTQTDAYEFGLNI